MNPAANKKAGARWEIELAEHLRYRTGQAIHRLRLNGTQDIGDMHLGIASGLCVIEAKNARAMDLAGWTAEAAAEAVNAGLPHWAVAIRRRGQRDPGAAYVALTVDEWLRQVGA